MAGAPRIPLEVRYERHIRRDPDGCWEWTGPCASSGYPQFRLGRTNKTISVHRWSYECENGPIPDGRLVLHHCDNRKCSRPSHLYCGTQADNMRDMRERGRADHTSGGRPSKLTPDQQREIVWDERPTNEIAAAFNVSEATVYRLKKKG